MELDIIDIDLFDVTLRSVCLDMQHVCTFTITDKSLDITSYTRDKQVFTKCQLYFAQENDTQSQAVR